jgi:1-acyl-sn-glycerol-3-phosphate acyltransferase
VSATDPQDEVWARRAPARAVRAAVLRGVFAPLVAGYAQVAVSGRATLETITEPVVFVANHASHVDTPILLGALPAARRRRTLVGAAADYFYTRRSLAIAVSLGFGTVPIHRRREAGGGEAPGGLAPLQRLLAEGFSLVLFAEGTRSRTGHLGEFRPGAAALAALEHVPLVPVHIAGTGALMGAGRAWMARADPADRRRRHHVRVDFGAPLRPAEPEAAASTMDEVRRFMAACA